MLTALASGALLLGLVGYGLAHAEIAAAARDAIARIHAKAGADAKKTESK